MSYLKACLLVAVGLLVGSVAGVGYGRTVRTAADATGEMHPAENLDVSQHEATFVAVEPGVQLEVLDWGGTGDALVLLTGLGDNAHVYDEFAHQFTDLCRVIGITRRGFGRSSQPAHGYDLDTRARDVIAVLDQLNIGQAVFAGHSVAGGELSKLGSDYPDRVKKLVYLDALDIASGGWNKIPQPPPAPDFAETDLVSLRRFSAASARNDGYRKPLAAVKDMVRTDAAGKVVDSVSPPEVSAKILAGLQPGAYDRIRAPTLGIFNRITPEYRLPYYGSLPPASQEAFNASVKLLAPWSEAEIQRFRSTVKNSRVVEFKDGNHYVFIVEVARVAREMRQFLKDR